MNNIVLSIKKLYFQYHIIVNISKIFASYIFT